MRFSLICIAFAFLFSCSGNSPEKHAEKKEDIQKESDPYAHIEGTPTGNYYNPKYIHFNDISLYDRRFIEETEDLRKHSEYNDFQFRDGSFVINHKDTFYFPETPAMMGRIVLYGKKDGINGTLKIKRVNFTSVDFEVRIEEKGKETHIGKGRATLLSGFFLGEESETLNGKNYPVSEFSYHSPDNECFAYIRVGMDGSGNYFATLSKNCNGGIRDLNAFYFTQRIY